MFCEKRLLDKKCKQVDTCVSSKDKRLSVCYQSSNIDEFLNVVHQPAHSSSKSVRLTSDIYMLFNQQRLDRMTQQALIQHFEDLAVKDSSFSALKSRLSDEQLCTVVKSRYIQSPSELLSWSRYLNSLADSELTSYIQTVQAEQEKKEADPIVNIVSSSNPDNVPK